MHHVHMSAEILSRSILGRRVFQKREVVPLAWCHRKKKNYRLSEYPEGCKRCQWQLCVHKYGLWPLFVVWEVHYTGISSKSTIFSSCDVEPVCVSLQCDLSFFCVTPDWWISNSMQTVVVVVSLMPRACWAMDLLRELCLIFVCLSMSVWQYERGDTVFGKCRFKSHLGSKQIFVLTMLC